jgi:hypothetical protein
MSTGLLEPVADSFEAVGVAGEASLESGEVGRCRREVLGNGGEAEVACGAELADLVAGGTLRELQPAARQRLVDDGARLAALAEQSTPDEFARTVRDHARRLEADGDGLARLERQRRAIRLSTWIDKVSGMGRWSATWDPATMVTLESRVDGQVEAMFHDTPPEGCPTDPLEKQAYLRALALLALLDGNGARVGRPELIVVEDHTNPDPDGQPSIDWGLDVDLPQEFLDDVRQRATKYTITVRNGVIIDAPGVLNLGRTTRLANRAQRRALRGLYATCAIPDAESATTAPNSTI